MMDRIQNDLQQRNLKLEQQLRSEQRRLEEVWRRMAQAERLADEAAQTCVALLIVMILGFAVIGLCGGGQ